MKQLSAEDKDLSESQELNHLRIHLNQEILKNQDLIGELNTLQKENVDLKFKLRQLQPGRSLSDELSRESTKADRFTQTEISYDRSGCNQ